MEWNELTLKQPPKESLKGRALIQLLFKKIGVSWEQKPVPGASLQDIDEQAVQSFVKKALRKRRISEEAVQTDMLTLLKNLELVNEKGELLLAALLLFGKKPTKYAIGAAFKIGRFGKSHGDLRFQDIIEGNLLDMADKVMEILDRLYLVRPISYQGLQRIEALEYPERALREAILNAIIHKDYSDTAIFLSVYDDRLMIWNSGKLPDYWTIEKLRNKHESKPRNELIAKIFFMAGYIESWGRGISIMIDSCKEYGIPEPMIAEEMDGIRVTFFKDIYTEEYFSSFGLTQRQIQALLYIKYNGRITNALYQKINIISDRTALRDLQELLRKGFIERIGSVGKGTSYVLKKQ